MTITAPGSVEQCSSLRKHSISSLLQISNIRLLTKVAILAFTTVSDEVIYRGINS